MAKKSGIPSSRIILAIAVLAAGAGAYYLLFYTNTYQTATASTTITSGQYTSTMAQQHYTIALASNATLGQYLTNSSGFTLYTYSNDSLVRGGSSCYGSCAASWPPFYAGNVTVPAGLSAYAFGAITRYNGSMQTTYKGMPLYRYIGDSAPGQVSGQGLDGEFYVVVVVHPATTTTSTSTSSTTSTFKASTTTSVPTTSTSTTTISQNATVICQTHNFLRVNESLSCPPVELTLVDVGQGNQQYQIANATVDVYLDGSPVLINESLLQNTTPYTFTLANGHNVVIYVYQATYSIYPVGRSANISIAYR